MKNLIRLSLFFALLIINNILWWKAGYYAAEFDNTVNTLSDWAFRSSKPNG